MENILRTCEKSEYVYIYEPWSHRIQHNQRVQCWVNTLARCWRVTCFQQTSSARNRLKWNITNDYYFSVFTWVNRCSNKSFTFGEFPVTFVASWQRYPQMQGESKEAWYRFWIQPKSTDTLGYFLTDSGLVYKEGDVRFKHLLILHISRNICKIEVTSFMCIIIYIEQHYCDLHKNNFSTSSSQSWKHPIFSQRHTKQVTNTDLFVTAKCRYYLNKHKRKHPVI